MKYIEEKEEGEGEGRTRRNGEWWMIKENKKRGN